MWIRIWQWRLVVKIQIVWAHILSLDLTSTLGHLQLIETYVGFGCDDTDWEARVAYWLILILSLDKGEMYEGCLRNIQRDLNGII